MDVKELKQGDVFYAIEAFSIVPYSYVGKYPYPTIKEGKSIILDGNDNCYVVDDEEISDTHRYCAFSYREALVKLLALHEAAIKDINGKIDCMERK